MIEKIKNCIKAGAVVTACGYYIDMASYTYENLVPNHNLALSFKKALDYLGVDSIQRESANYAWDIRNVSRVCPVIGAYIKIGNEDLVGHTEAFRNASNSEEGFKGMLITAKAMGMTGVDYLMNQNLRNKVKEEFLSKKNNRYIIKRSIARLN